MRDSVVLTLAAAPLVAATWALRRACESEEIHPTPRQQSGGEGVCHGYLAHPTLTLHTVIFGTYVLGFWAHSLVAGSTWLLDAARPLLPLCIQLYYLSHPRAVHSERMLIGATLIIMWALRLFRAHGRRYEWALSSKEDWRRADLREAFDRWWPAASLPVAFIAEQGAACARCLPLRSLAGLTGPETFTHELICPPSMEGIIGKSLTVNPVEPTITDPNQPVRFQVAFEPLRPFSTSVKLVIVRSTGGRCG